MVKLHECKYLEQLIQYCVRYLFTDVYWQSKVFKVLLGPAFFLSVFVIELMYIAVVEKQFIEVHNWVVLARASNNLVPLSYVL